MKSVINVCFLCLLALWAGCSDDEEERVYQLELQPDEITLEAEGGLAILHVKAPGDWAVGSGMPEWCEPVAVSGTGDGELKIEVSPNPSAEERQAVIEVRSENGNGQCRIVQKGSIPVETGEREIPVVFHVIYQDPNDPLQNVPYERLTYLLERVNENYHRNHVDVKFVLAETDPQGEMLAEPGVERVQWQGSYPINYEDIMGNNESKYNYLTWDQNRYVNILLYQMSMKGLLGVSHMAYGRASRPMEGLTGLSDYVDASQLAYAHCVSVNSLYINHESTDMFFDTMDATVTLTHELGHYLGLFHVFSEPEPGMPACADTDYCADTPTYIQANYHQWLEQFLREHQGERLALGDLARREACDGTVFTSTNYMDYDYVFYSEFTDEQRARMDYVLNYSPLIPGPRQNLRDTRAVSHEKLDLPIRMHVCPAPGMDGAVHAVGH